MEQLTPLKQVQGKLWWRMLKSYLKKIFEIANGGDAREESYYTALEGLLRSYAESTGKKDINITKPLV